MKKEVNHLSVINRDWSKIMVNEIWISHHQQFDCAVKIQSEDGNWKTVRPWLCGFMDAKSQLITGYQVTVENPDSETIRKCLDHGIKKHGKPKYIYSDNGKNVKNEDIDTNLRELLIKPVSALPYNGRSKTIERRFSNIIANFNKYLTARLEGMTALEELAVAFDEYLVNHHGLSHEGNMKNDDFTKSYLTPNWGDCRKVKKSGIELIAEERQRQIEKEGWTKEHDNRHKHGELAIAAACYAVNHAECIDVILFQPHEYMKEAFPWSEGWDKRSKHNKNRSLVIAGALIAAELDRLNSGEEK